MNDPPWVAERLSPETAAAVRSALGRLVDGIVAAVGAENPGYAQVLSDPAGLGIRMGIGQALSTFLDAVERGEPPAPATDEVWRRLGEAEFQAGRSLDALRAAFRTGTRAAWRAAAEVASETDVESSALITLAEGIFVYSDSLAADVAEGYLRMQSDEAGERERRRRRLAALLLDGEEHDAEAIERAAAAARWPLPRQLSVLAIDGESATALARQLDLDVLHGAGPDGAWLVLPDPAGPGRSERLRLAVAESGLPTALGPPVAPREGHRSLRWARQALALMSRGALPDERPTYVSAHLAQMIVLGDDGLAQALVGQRLAAIRRLPIGEQQRLLATLGAWLAHQRHTPAVAAQLHVHPQTVRYRIAKMRELLGGALDTPDGRFELELALRASALARSQS